MYIYIYMRQWPLGSISFSVYSCVLSFFIANMLGFFKLVAKSNYILSDLVLPFYSLFSSLSSCLTFILPWSYFAFRSSPMRSFPPSLLGLFASPFRFLLPFSLPCRLQLIICFSIASLPLLLIPSPCSTSLFYFPFRLKTGEQKSMSSMQDWHEKSFPSSHTCALQCSLLLRSSCLFSLSYFKIPKRLHCGSVWAFRPWKGNSNKDRKKKEEEEG